MRAGRGQHSRSQGGGELPTEAEWGAVSVAQASPACPPTAGRRTLAAQFGGMQPGGCALAAQWAQLRAISRVVVRTGCERLPG